MNDTTLEQLRDEIAALKAKFNTLEAEHRATARRSRRRLLAAALTGCLAMAWASTPKAVAQFGLTLAGLNTRLIAVEAKTAPVSVAGTDFTISGMNVHVVSGRGETLDLRNLGNLTIGYNELRNDGSDVRQGAHHLILGSGNNYSAFGGLVAGAGNEASGAYSTVTGGAGNKASGEASSVSGGQYNNATFYGASVSGGISNLASGYNASVSGGAGNEASGAFSSVSGGNDRFAPRPDNWAAGNYFSDF